LNFSIHLNSEAMIPDSTRLQIFFRLQPVTLLTTLRKLILLIILIISLCYSGLIEARQSSTEARVDALFEPVNTDSTPGCALSVMNAGDIIYKNGYGMANLEYGVEITPSSVFHVASVSKQFTAMAVQLLVNDEKVSWDDDIRKYIPEVPDFGQTITLRHLAHHVSGIRDQWSLLMQAGWRWESDVVTQKDVINITSRQQSLNFEPGTRYLYSNTGYTLLAVVVERVSGQTFREFTNEHIFEPLGMYQTHFQDDHRRIVKNRAWAYEPHRSGEYGMRNSVPVFDVVGASSLFTTVEDMAAWDRNMYSGEVGGIEGVEQLHEPFILSNGDTISYRRGLIQGTHRGLTTIGHGGSDAGYRSQYIRIPDHELSIAVFCNFPGSGPELMSRLIAGLYLPSQQQSVSEQSNNQNRGEKLRIDRLSEELQELEGIYVAQPGDRIISLTYENERLNLNIGPGLPLQPLEDDHFAVDGSGLELRINPPGTSEIGHLYFIDQSDSDIYVRHDFWSPEPGDLEEYAGRYFSSELGTEYSFTVENGRLRFHHRKLDSQSLYPVFPDAFRSGGRTIVFTRDEDHQLNGFRVSDSRVWGVRFDRIQ
jgi:CubicO group peptidase (beta-lactamase class C family)